MTTKYSLTNVCDERLPYLRFVFASSITAQVHFRNAIVNRKCLVDPGVATDMIIETEHFQCPCEPCSFEAFNLKQLNDHSTAAHADILDQHELVYNAHERRWDEQHELLDHPAALCDRFADISVHEPQWRGFRCGSDGRGADGRQAGRPLRRPS